VIDSLTDATVASRCRATVTQSERDELRRMVFGANRHNYVLPASAHVGHRRTDRAGRQLGSQITWSVAFSYARNLLPHAHGACGVPMTASLPSPMNNRVF